MTELAPRRGGAALLAIAALWALPAHAASELLLEPLGVVTLVLTGHARVTPGELGELEAAIDASLRASLVERASLGPRRAAFEACVAPNQFLCWTRALSGPGPDAGILVLLSLQSSGLTGIALRVDAAARIAALGASEEELDSRVFSEAVLPLRFGPASEGPVGERLLERLRPWLAPATDRGTVRLIEPPSGHAFFLDGLPLGSAREIRAVRTGTRALTVQRGELLLARRELVVRAGAITRVADFGVARAEPIASPPLAAAPQLLEEPSRPLRAINLYGGAALLATSVVLFAITPSFATPPRYQLCLDRSCALPSHASVGTGGPGEGVLLAPLGAGVALAGAGMLGGGLLVEEHDWLPLVLGPALGAIGYALLSLAAPSPQR